MTHDIRRKGLWTADAFVSAVLESGRWTEYGLENYASAYAEPGYTDPTDGCCILFGNWNEETRWQDGQRIVTSDKAKRFSAIAEHVGHELEWYDEWSTCSDCGKAVRTSADSYSWQPSYVLMHECEIICTDCIDWPEYLESIQDDPHSACVADCDPSEYGYQRLSDAREYENGFHPGQTDDPAAILKQLHARGVSGVVFRVPETSQFYIRFETWVRITHFEKPLARGSVALCGTSNDDDSDAPVVDDRRAVTCEQCLELLADSDSAAEETERE